MADDFVIGTGESHTVREFVEKIFSYAGIEIEWRGEGILGKESCQKCKKEYKHC
mgnify:CR=1 FL=1